MIYYFGVVAAADFNRSVSFIISPPPPSSSSPVVVFIGVCFGITFRLYCFRCFFFFKKRSGKAITSAKESVR